jgi:hypothetical protein
VSGNCKDPYNFNLKGTRNSLVVNAVISDKSGPQYIVLGTTAGPKQSPDPLEGAQVTISDENDIQENLKDIGKGKYQLDQTKIKGRKTGLYILDIQLPDGRHYKSTAETMSSPQASDNAYFRVETETLVSSEGVSITNDNVMVYLNTLLPLGSEPAYLRWAIEEVYCIIPSCSPRALACPPYCYIYQEVSKYNLELVKTTDFNTRELHDILLQKRAVDYTFMVRHFFNISQYSMNPNAFDYWKKVQLLTQRSGSIFDTPPAAVPGNIHNVNDPSETVFGYFEASAERLTRIYVDKGFITTDVTACTWDFRIPAGNYYSYCINCNSVRGSTNTRPDWFF